MVKPSAGVGPAAAPAAAGVVGGDHGVAVRDGGVWRARTPKGDAAGGGVGGGAQGGELAGERGDGGARIGEDAAQGFEAAREPAGACVGVVGFGCVMGVCAARLSGSAALARDAHVEAHAPRLRMIGMLNPLLS